MLLSMTGFGEAQIQRDGLSVAAEVRSINSRYLKITVRCGEGYAALEPRAEKLLRGRLRRGTIQANVRITRKKTHDDYRIDTELLDRYFSGLEQWRKGHCPDAGINPDALLLLPGVIEEQPVAAAEEEEDWPLIDEAIAAALENLDKMRVEEGRAMEADMRKNCDEAILALDVIAKRAPLVAESYRKKLQQRLEKILCEHDLQLEPGDIIKEIGLFAERSDISEEIVRLRSHFEQFFAAMDMAESAGRKLDFITQEMFREANTIGSKANDVEIAQSVIEIKAGIERLREMIQNVE